MDFSPAIHLIEDKKVPGTISFIDNADHQLVFQNPIELANQINNL